MTIAGVAAFTLLLSCFGEEASTRPDFTSSVKKSSATEPSSYHITQGRFSAQNVTAGFLVAIAYGVQSFQVIDGPGWMETEPFDIEAKLDDPRSDRGREPQMIAGG
jgi:uncharacterized protein (TIGR03435 family)